MGRTKKVTLLVVLCGALSVTAFLLYGNYFNQLSVRPQTSIEIFETEQPIPTGFEDGFIASEAFLALQQFSPAVVASGPTGRANPFQPIDYTPEP